MNNVSGFLVFFLVVITREITSSDHSPSVIRLAVLLEGNSTQHEEDIIQLAVNQINSDVDILPDTEIDYVIRRVPDGDSFAAVREVCSLLDLQISAVVSASTCDVTSALKSVLDNYHMTYISVSRGQCPRARLSRSPPKDGGYTFSIRPNISLGSMAMLHLMEALNWSEIVVFYDDSEGQKQIEDLLQNGFQDSSPPRVVMVAFENSFATRQILASVKEKNMKHFAVYCRIENAVQILLQAASFGMTVGDYQWVIMGQETSDAELNYFDDVTGIVTLLRQVLHMYSSIPKFAEAWRLIRRQLSSDCNIISFDQMQENCPRDTSIVMHAAYLYDAIHVLATAMDDLIRKNKWIKPRIIGCQGEGARVEPMGNQRFKRILHKIKTSGLTGDISFQNSCYNDNVGFELMSIEHINNESRCWRIGSWDPFNNLRLAHIPFTRNFDRYNKNQTLRIVTIKESPFMMQGESHDAAYMGYCMDLINEIAKGLKVKVSIYDVPDGKYGGQEDDGTWNGLVGEVYYGRADIAVAGMIITSERERVVDFTKPFMSYGVGILIRKPQKTTNTFAFLQPLRISVWGCIFASILATGIVLFILDRLSPFSSHNTKEDAEEKTKFDLMNSLWFTFSGFMQQGADYTPLSVSSRIMGAFWWFCSLIVVATYTANLAAFLTVSRMDSTINSLDDLAHQSRVMYGTIEDSSLMRWFRTRADKDPLYSRMWSFMSTVKPSVWVTSAEEGYQKVMKEDYAFFWDAPILEYVKQTNCDVMTVGKPFNLKGYGIATPRGAPYREDISVILLNMQEQGKLEELKRKWFNKESMCSLDTSTGQPRDIQLETVAGVFYVLAIGTAFSYITLFVEIIWRLYRKYVKQLESQNSTEHELTDFEPKP
ncbi:glutamate receptor ionotropic, kainate 2-like [Saccoglossus kowalevskii]|uniref:Glutamate receptor ionotropic, kainate 2-like n=1 Tax=Saccoglossus kowalevskii TaxID=10224 RepID=A0ABM0GP78_SACKO|nr:PREDICTED: glutamate receptor ionotropic, kainate 2-like [Saccoglossus kowalevskii]